MEMNNKAIYIQAILNYLREQVKVKNHKLAAENLYSEQEAFDEGDMFFKLAFMDDDAVKEIAGKILV